MKQCTSNNIFYSFYDSFAQLFQENNNNNNKRTRISETYEMHF